MNSSTFREQTTSFEIPGKKKFNAYSDFGIKIASKSTKSSFLFAISKFHKNSIIFRFITRSAKTFVRYHSIRVNEVLDGLWKAQSISVAPLSLPSHFIQFRQVIFGMDIRFSVSAEPGNLLALIINMVIVNREGQSTNTLCLLGK